MVGISTISQTVKPEKDLKGTDISERLSSIDVFRAITMLLMIFVNDLWTLQGIPECLGHKPAEVNGLGLADIVFPAFLFIVGLSIPFAINNRINKGDSPLTVFGHILVRSLALIVMGFFHVNLDSYNTDTAFLSKPTWQVLITLSFFLIWLDYPKKLTKTKRYLFQGAGILLLMTMSFLYSGGTVEQPAWMKVQWWGILGLIGWSYLIASVAYLLLMKKPRLLLYAFVFFLAFSSATKLGWLGFLSFVKPYFWILSDGGLPALVMAGIICSVYFRLNASRGKQKDFWALLITFALSMAAFGLQTRSIWGIHKIGASPSWVALCIGLSIITFGFLIWLVDQKGKKSWFNIIRPAGTSTLTCYLLPYIHYALYSICGVSLPLFFRTGTVGILKSLLYALIIILITGLLERWKIRLRI